jgi:hypothetical protein
MAEFDDFFRSRFDEVWSEQIKEMSRLYPLRGSGGATEDARSSSTTKTARDPVVMDDGSGDTVVEAGANVRVTGNLNGNLVVHPHAVVHVQGDIAGDVVAMGSLVVDGDIGGSVVVRPR